MLYFFFTTTDALKLLEIISYFFIGIITISITTLQYASILKDTGNEKTEFDLVKSIGEKFLLSALFYLFSGILYAGLIGLSIVAKTPTPLQNAGLITFGIGILGIMIITAIIFSDGLFELIDYFWKKIFSNIFIKYSKTIDRKEGDDNFRNLLKTLWKDYPNETYKETEVNNIIRIQEVRKQLIDEKVLRTEKHGNSKGDEFLHYGLGATGLQLVSGWKTEELSEIAIKLSMLAILLGALQIIVQLFK